MKKYVLIVLICLITLSCNLNSPPPVFERTLVTSQNLFVVKGKAYTSFGGELPITLYNPNNYEITITVGSESMKINPLSSITIQTLTQSDREVEA